jgi:hypothetical protein
MISKYSAADYGFQLVTVTAGVLIALMIDGLVDWNNNRDLVAEAHAALRREISDNLKELGGLPKAVESSNAQVETALKFADDLLSTGKTGMQEFSLGFDLATLNQSSWQSAERTGALAHMTYDDVRNYSELYALQELFSSQQRKAVDLVANAIMITTGADPTKASKEELAHFRQQLQFLRANVFVTNQLGALLTEAYQKFLQQ